ncbi:MAG TPA: MinD/ParA family protein [Armatimonadetes bacterium]|nr:MinD/ParA family protein [Armatimonadota bacterium]
MRPKGKVLTVTGGKGGVGKTTLACNFALSFSRMGFLTAVVDADYGLANADVMFDVLPERTLGDVVAGRCDLSEVGIEVAEGCVLFPGGSGLPELLGLTREDRERLLREVEGLKDRFDFVVVDTAPGIWEEILDTAVLGDLVIVVTSPCPMALTDAYAIVKWLHKYGREEVEVVVNKAGGAVEAMRSFETLQKVVSAFMPELKVSFLGWVPRDPAVVVASRSRTPVVRAFPHSPSSMRIEEICARVLRKQEVG